MTFIKENWFKIIISSTLVLVGCSIIYYFTFYLPRYNNRINDDFSYQEKCATQAQKTFNTFENGMKTGGFNGFGQQNHYNQKLNRCFMLVTYYPSYPPNTDASKLVSNSEILMDAYENSDLATCDFFANKPPYDIALNSMCIIGSNKVTYKEYLDFASNKMELSY